MVQSLVCPLVCSHRSPAPELLGQWNVFVQFLKCPLSLSLFRIATRNARPRHIHLPTMTCLIFQSFTLAMSPRHVSISHRRPKHSKRRLREALLNETALKWHNTIGFKEWEFMIAWGTVWNLHWFDNGISAWRDLSGLHFWLVTQARSNICDE